MAICSVCQRSEPEPPLTWTREKRDGELLWVCDTCARDNLRSIEAKLDRQWW